MLTYLVNVVGDLVATAVLAGLALALARAVWDGFGVRVMCASLALGAVASAVVAALKQNTSLVDTGQWNMVYFGVAACAFVLFVAGYALKGAKNPVARNLGLFALALFVLCRVLYKLPGVIIYPFTFSLSDNNIVSTDFVFRLTGWLVGLVIAVLVCMALFKFVRSLSQRTVGIATIMVMAVLAVVQVMTMLQTMLARRIIPQNHDLFTVVKWFSNNTDVFTFVVLGVAAVLGVMVFARSLRDDEPYSNPAQHRKNRARWRNRRRWATCCLACVLASALTVTVVEAYANQEPELSPSEEFEIRDGNAFVSLAQVEDGHLHRFTYETQAGYTTESGTECAGGVGVRFIIIKKPGSNAYGIGLDACDICGETGYYERDGQVVCKLCDVVMNINTIGFKGGCNPIPIQYTVGDGGIIVPIDALADYEKTFK